MKKTFSGFENCVQLQASLHLKAHATMRKLTPREKIITILVWTEFSDKGICDALSMSHSTLRCHLKNLFKKLTVNTRVGIGLAYERSLHSTPGRLFPWVLPLQKRPRTK
jgi:DNA-binding NarL/FixJ family response regulator